MIDQVSLEHTFFRRLLWAHLTEEQVSYLQWVFRNVVIPHYIPPATVAGYDLNHILEMFRWVRVFLEDTEEFHDMKEKPFPAVVAVVLHNGDRPNALKSKIRPYDEGGRERFRVWLKNQLESVPMSGEDERLVVEAILDHSKRDDGPEDSDLLIILRSADKFCRWGALGQLGQFVNRGRTHMLYDPVHPFAYADAQDMGSDELQLCAFVDTLRVLEWVNMVNPKVKNLIPYARVAESVENVRRIGRRITEECVVYNGTEDCLRKALGPRYIDFLTAG